MRVSEEAAWVLDNLVNMEASSVVNTIGVVGADEERSLQAAVRGTALIGPGGVGESLGCVSG